MKQFFLIIVFYILICSCNSLYSQYDTNRVYLIFDEPYNNELPRNFRKCNGGMKREYSKLPDTTGLNDLNISGGAEFSAMNLPVVLDAIGVKFITIFDLRQETHGFVNGMPISWYGHYDWADTSLSHEEILALEQKRLDSVKQAKVITVSRLLQKNRLNDTFGEIKDSTFPVKITLTEEELSKEIYAAYFRITCADHRQPAPEDADHIVSYANGNGIRPKWIYFHCHAGDGRTTTFMAMYDMIKNAKSVGFDDIIERQYLIGGINLSKDEDFPAWDKEYAIQRTGFLKDFYDYCRQNGDGFKTPYSKWTGK